MPKVKYLKDLCSGRAGSVHDLQEYEANILITLGVAKLLSDKVKKNALKPPNLLTNLNGTPVVNDFGELVEAAESAENPIENGKKSAQKGE